MMSRRELFCGHVFVSFSVCWEWIATQEHEHFGMVGSAGVEKGTEATASG